MPEKIGFRPTTEALQEKGKWQIDEYRIEWPLAGDVRLCGNELLIITRDKLNKEGSWTFESLKVGTEEGEDIPPRVLSLKASETESAIDWFVRKGFFERDKEKEPWTLKITNKWKELFVETKPSQG